MFQKYFSLPKFLIFFVVAVWMLGQLGIIFGESRNSRNARKRLETERMWILGHFQGGPRGPNFFGDSPMGLLSPLENSELGAIGRPLKLHFCKWHFLPIFTQPDQIELFLLISSNKFLLNGYKHSGTLFLGSSYHYLFKNIAHVRGICRFYPNCIFVFVFVYLCICIVYLHVRDL